MKRRLFILFILICLTPACSRYVYHIKGPSKSNKVALLPGEEGELPKPYKVNGKRYYPLPNAYGFTEIGKASWYGKKFHGRPTSSGEIYNMYSKSAAHKTLPLGTFVKVTNLSNRKMTVVRINDRGPFIKGRIIDLSYTAAKEIDLVGVGVAKVEVIALAPEVGNAKTRRGSTPIVDITGLETGEFTVQVGAYQDRTNAEKIAERLRVLFNFVQVTIHVDDDRRTLHRVQASKSQTLAQAEKIEKRLEAMGFKAAFIVRI